jgi:hypothetical protein
MKDSRDDDISHLSGLRSVVPCGNHIAPLHLLDREALKECCRFDFPLHGRWLPDEGSEALAGETKGLQKTCCSMNHSFL